MAYHDQPYPMVAGPKPPHDPRTFRAACLADLRRGCIVYNADGDAFLVTRDAHRVGLKMLCEVMSIPRTARLHRDKWWHYASGDDHRPRPVCVDAAISPQLFVRIAPWRQPLPARAVQPRDWLFASDELPPHPVATR